MVVMVAIVKIATGPVVGLEINCLRPPVIPWWYARSADVIPPEVAAGDPGNANRHEMRSSTPPTRVQVPRPVASTSQRLELVWRSQRPARRSASARTRPQSVGRHGRVVLTGRWRLTCLAATNPWPLSEYRVPNIRAPAS